VKKGETVVICGPNGAGKTTLLRLAAGLLAPRKGSISICGRTLDRMVRREIFRQVGIMAQDPNDQLFCPYVEEDVAYGPTNLGLTSAEIQARVMTAMELTEVSYLAKRPIHTLSHGEMKRVGLAGIIAMQPPLILLDEPTAGLDPASAQHLVELIQHLNQDHGYTIVIVTHDIDIAAQVANRIIILKNGLIRADGKSKEILTDQSLLVASRLKPPILTQLFQRLDPGDGTQEDIPVTIEEAVALLQRLRSSSANQNQPMV
jgi:energy-coupling factor transporter ATP-binding protein EcfA2